MIHLAIINLTNGTVSGGYQKYINNVIPRMRNSDNFNIIDVYVSPKTALSVNNNAHPIIVWPENDHKTNFSWVRKNINDKKPDIIFYPTARYLNIRNIPKVVMVRNMEPLTQPLCFHSISESIRNIHRYFAAKKAAMASTRIIAVSNYVKDYIINKWGIEKNNVGVVYHGINFDRDNTKFIKPKSFNDLINGEFIFTAGSIRPARGLEPLIKAFSQFKLNNKSIKLVIAGNIDPKMSYYKKYLVKLSSKLNCKEDIMWTGLLGENEMKYCFHNCRLFIMTSRAEACPNIVLEALSNGSISISTQQQPMPEFFRDSALYYTPENHHSLYEALQEGILLDDVNRNKLSRKAKNRSLDFSWDICAESTIKQILLV